jgi:hypothetical protein
MKATTPSSNDQIESHRKRLDRLAKLYEQLDEQLSNLEERLEVELPPKPVDEPRPKPR